MVGRVTLDKTDNNDNADNARLNITSSRARVCPDLDRAKIVAHSLHIVIIEEYSNGQFKLGTRYILILVWNNLSKISLNLDTY